MLKKGLMCVDIDIWYKYVMLVGLIMSQFGQIFIFGVVGVEQVGRSDFLFQFLVCVLDYFQLSVCYFEIDQIKYNYLFVVNNLLMFFVVNLVMFVVVLCIDNVCIGNVCGYVNKF